MANFLKEHLKKEKTDFRKLITGTYKPLIAFVGFLGAVMALGGGLYTVVGIIIVLIMIYRWYRSNKMWPTNIKQ